MALSTLAYLMTSLARRFFEALVGPCSISRGSTLVAAVSGGPDSMAMLYLLAGVRQQLDLDLTAVWVDHALRPEETPAEYAACRSAAQSLQLPLVDIKVDVLTFAENNHLSLEHAARDLRYKALRATALQVQANAIVVAHTADDQSEEILIRLLRGSGRKGVAGMQMKNGDLVRPLLHIEKQELLNWLQDQKISYCLDSSNEDSRFVRNRIRHGLLPYLEKNFDQGIRSSLRKTADSLAADETLLQELTENVLATVICQSDGDGGNTVRLLRHPFNQLHEALQRRVVEHLLWQLGSRARYEHILLILQAAAAGRHASELHLSRGLRVGVFSEYLEFSYPKGTIPWRGRLLHSKGKKVNVDKREI